LVILHRAHPIRTLGSLTIAFRDAKTGSQFRAKVAIRGRLPVANDKRHLFQVGTPPRICRLGGFW
jgi:hypothetical protein